jgi:hypothetical protein
MNRFNIVFLRTTGHSCRKRMLVSFSPNTDASEAQSRSGLERLHLKNNVIINWLSTLTSSLDCYSSNSLTSCGNALFKQLYLAWKRRKEAKNDQNKCSAKPKMAGIYEKPPLFKSQKTWNEKTILPEVYKLTSPNPGQSWSKTINCSYNSNILFLRNNKCYMFLVFNYF